MKNILLSIALLLQLAGAAQYYYTDVLGSAETAVMLANYRKAKVQAVRIVSYDADNTRNEAFEVIQRFNSAQNTLTTITKSDASNPSVLTTFIDEAGRVTKTIDSTESTITTSLYNYNADGRLTKLHSTAADTSGSFTQTEEHIWFWAGSTPQKMQRIKNGIEKWDVIFKVDEAGRVTEENAPAIAGRQAEPVYYYYDTKGRLTDIVRFNRKARRLLPEYMFEYNAADQPVQRITVPANGSDYLIWRYQYDAAGLKIKEAVYNKQKQLNGKIEYQYSFGG